MSHASRPTSAQSHDDDDLAPARGVTWGVIAMAALLTLIAFVVHAVRVWLG